MLHSKSYSCESRMYYTSRQSIPCLFTQVCVDRVKQSFIYSTPSCRVIVMKMSIQILSMDNYTPVSNEETFLKDFQKMFLGSIQCIACLLQVQNFSVVAKGYIVNFGITLPDFSKQKAELTLYYYKNLHKTFFMEHLLLQVTSNICIHCVYMC